MNNKGADQTARIRRLICAFVVRIWHKQVFSWCGSYILNTKWCTNCCGSVQTSSYTLLSQSGSFEINSDPVYRIWLMITWWPNYMLNTNDRGNSSKWLSGIKYQWGSLPLSYNPYTIYCYNLNMASYVKGWMLSWMTLFHDNNFTLKYHIHNSSALCFDMQPYWKFYQLIFEGKKWA